MKVLIVSGSKRNGNSEFLSNVLYEHICGLSVPVDLSCIKLSELKLNYCTGCLECDETEKCCINDEMTDLVDLVAEVDGFVFISPVRWSLISGEMKTFLDRLNPLAVSMKLSGKKCITIVIGQSEQSEGDSVLEASKSFKAFADNAEIIICKQIEVFSCLEGKDIAQFRDSIELCKKACEELIANIEG